MKFLPEPVFLIIYNYVGHNALYLNNAYYKYLMKCRKEFIEKPLKIEYRLCKWRQKRHDIENQWSRSERPTMCVEKDAEQYEITGNICIENIHDNGYIEGVSKKLEKELIPTSEMTYTTYPLACIILNYWTIFEFKCVDMERCKRYQSLWINCSQDH